MIFTTLIYFMFSNCRKNMTKHRKSCSRTVSIYDSSNKQKNHGCGHNINNYSNCVQCYDDRKLDSSAILDFGARNLISIGSQIFIENLVPWNRLASGLNPALISTINLAASEIPVPGSRTGIIRSAIAAVTVNSGSIFFALDVNGNILSFDSTNAAEFTTRPIIGIPAGETVVAIARNPSTGELIAVTNGSNQNLYVLNSTDPNHIIANFLVNITGVLLLGNRFSASFNPTLNNSLRLVSDLNQNLRIDILTGVAVMQGNINNGGPISGISYIANGTLYDIDPLSGILYTQDLASGTLTAVGNLNIPGLSALIGFAIQNVNGIDTGFAILTVNGETALYQINLTTGAAIFFRPLNAGDLSIIGLVVAPQPSNGTVTFTIYKNGIATNFVINVPFIVGNTSQISSTGCLIVNPGDRISVRANGTPIPTNSLLTFTAELERYR